jgi:signal transduction histidine kinase
MDGIELLKRIKEKDPTIVVIVMTGFAEKDVILNALKADADDFISKPLNLLQLKTAVQKALIKKALKDEIASLRSLDRLKSNFLSIISHKFRTPITAISLFLQNLGSNTFKSNDPELRANVRLVSDESAYLERLVAELLVFSRMMVHGESLTCEPVSLGRIITDIVAGSREIAAKPSVETVLDIQPIPEIHADRDKIAFALQQVIDNAYKFSGETGTVTIVLREEGESVVVSVADTGCGMASEEIPKIFEKFYQVDPYNTGQVRGFGLGLYYAREFVRMHGGSITVESVVDRGTRVIISIPRQAAASSC